MGKRIRRGKLTVGTEVADVSGFDWNDAYEFDRSPANDEFSGTPVEMKRGGSGTLTLLAGTIASGYQTNNWVYAYTEVQVIAGAESTVTKTATFTGVTVNRGASVPAEGKGEVKIAFDYSTSAVA